MPCCSSSLKIVPNHMCILLFNLGRKFNDRLYPLMISRVGCTVKLYLPWSELTVRTLSITASAPQVRCSTEKAAINFNFRRSWELNQWPHASESKTLTTGKLYLSKIYMLFYCLVIVNLSKQLNEEFFELRTSSAERNNFCKISKKLEKLTN